MWGGISKRVRSKSYVEQSCFDYSVVSLQWYSSCTCTYVVTDAEGIGQTHQSLKVWGTNHGTLATIVELSAMEKSHHSHVAQC